MIVITGVMCKKLDWMVWKWQFQIFLPLKHDDFRPVFPKKFLYKAHFLSLCVFFVGKWYKNAVWLLVFFPFFCILMSTRRCRPLISLVRTDVQLHCCAEVSIFLYFFVYVMSKHVCGLFRQIRSQ
jgi:hypothetical protein